MLAHDRVQYWHPVVEVTEFNKVTTQCGRIFVSNYITKPSEFAPPAVSHIFGDTKEVCPECLNNLRTMANGLEKARKQLLRYEK